MRQYARVTLVVVISYLIQSTILPYLKIGGVILDLITIALFAVGHTMGPYVAVPAGVLCALIMEVSSGDLPGLTTVYCLAAAGLGAWLVWYLPRKTEQLRDQGRMVQKYAPMALLAVIAFAKELVYVAYFYLTGMEMGWSHLVRCLLSGLIVGAASFALFPLIRGYLRRRPEDTLLARWLRRRKARRRPKSVDKEAEGLQVQAQGGADA